MSEEKKESSFLVDEHILQFECKYAVFRSTRDISVCYVRDEQLGDLVASALNHFEESGKLDEYIKEHNE